MSNSNNKKERVMHDAMCDDCGKSCQVPFAPSPEKPVYCDDCFSHKNQRAPQAPQQNTPGSGAITRKQLDQLHAKLDRILRMLSNHSQQERQTPVKAPKGAENLALKEAIEKTVQEEKPEKKPVTKKAAEKKTTTKSSSVKTVKEKKPAAEKKTTAKSSSTKATKDKKTSIKKTTKTTTVKKTAAKQTTTKKK